MVEKTFKNRFFVVVLRPFDPVNPNQTPPQPTNQLDCGVAGSAYVTEGLLTAGTRHPGASLFPSVNDIKLANGQRPPEPSGGQLRPPDPHSGGQLRPPDLHSGGSSQQGTPSAYGPRPPESARHNPHGSPQQQRQQQQKEQLQADPAAGCSPITLGMTS